MKIGIIGTGTVGQALAAGASAAGHETIAGSREPVANQLATTEVVSQRAAADRGDVVVLAVPAGVGTDVAAEVGDALVGKPVIDPTNEYPTAKTTEPVAVRVAEAAPDAHVVKAFNTIGANRMTDPVIDGEPASMFLAGDDADAVDTVGGLASDLGFEPVVTGDLTAAGHLEHLGRFWIHLSREHGRDIAFRLLQARTGTR